MFTLDIGCGTKPKGDINCDLYLDPRHREPGEIDTKKTRNFVLCDSHNLPFRQCIFDKAYMFEVLEHLENPSRAIKEVFFVLKPRGQLEGSVPNLVFLPRCKINARWENKLHIQGWDEMLLQQFFRRNGFITKKIWYWGSKKGRMKLIFVVAKMLFPLKIFGYDPDRLAKAGMFFHAEKIIS